VITRRSVLLAGGIGLLVAQSLSRGESAATIRRVGLSLGSEASTHLRAAFTQGMQDLGWLEGKNIEYRIVYGRGDVDHLDALASELTEQRVEVIVTSTSQFARAAQRATKTIPIVMAGVLNAVGAGFIASLAKPGGNITGITTQQEEVLGKLIGILHEVAPEARRIAILLNENHPSHALFWAGAQSACAALSLVPLRVVASAPGQLRAAIEQISRQRAQAVAVIPDSLYFLERANLKALNTRLPVGYQLREHVDAGGLLSYGADLAANWRHAATYVDKILKGAKPADLPVEQAPKYELVINLRTAKALGLTVPKDLLLRADEVIQ
jgi:putative ABC transport system substrate-binding protein